MRSRHPNDHYQAPLAVVGSGVAAITSEPRVASSHPLPLVDVVAHAKAVHVRSAHWRSDLITTATIYGAAVLATGGFVVATVVDELLRIGGGRRARASP